MRQTRQERAAQRHEAWALQWSDAGQHPWAIDAANEAVTVLRPVAAQHPSAMARALATRAACLHVRGREAEAVQDIEQCMAYRDQAHGPASRVDLARVAMLLERAGRTSKALALAEQLVADARALPDPRSAAPMVVRGDLLLRHARVEEALVALREAYTTAPRLSVWQVKASALLFEALGKAGRLDELEEHAYRDLSMFEFSFGSARRRMAYIRLLEVLERHHVASTRLPPVAAVIARQRRKLDRQLRRRRALVKANT
jgi:tetratricopeptide (TPR) repeat protein